MRKASEESVKQYLSKVLHDFKINQKEFAKILGLNEKTVSRWIRLNVLPTSIAFLIEIAIQLNKYRSVSFQKFLKKSMDNKYI